MEDLLSQFYFLSDHALHDKNFDPSAIEDLMKLFELESYKAWVAMELEHEAEVQKTEQDLREAEDYLESAMENAMEEFRRFEMEMNSEAEKELSSLVKIGESARKMGKSMEKVANMAAKKYVEAAMNSAGATMRSVWKGVSSNKVHPS